MNKSKLCVCWSGEIAMVIACVLIFSGCKGPAVPMETPTFISPSLTSTVTATITPELSVPNFFPVEDVSEQYGDLIEFDPDFVNLPGDTYLIGEGDFGNTLYYFTMDGGHSGQIGKVLRFIPPFSDDDGRYGYLTTNLANPLYLTIYSSNWIDSGDDQNPVSSGSGKVLIRKVDLISGETSAWLATVRVDDEMLCQGDYLSPDGRWLAGNCWKDGENYLYLLDLSSGTGRFLYSPQNPCQTYEATYRGGWWAMFNSPANDGIIRAYCRDEGRSFYMHCSISLESGEFSCQRPNYAQAEYHFSNRSPDGSKVAVRVIPGGEQKYSYLYVTDWECIVDFHACTEYVRAPIGDGEALYYSIGATWDRTGERFIWTHYPLTAGSIQPFTKINIANISTGAVTSFDGPRGAYLLGLSPDDQWLVLRNDEDLMLLSINGQTLRRLPRPGGQPASFLGWLVIP